MSMPEESREPRVRRRWTFGAAIVAIIGLVILTLSGLCTGLSGFGMIFTILTESGRLSANEWAALIGTLTTLAIFGGIPMLIGFFIARAGFKMRRKD